MATAFVSGASSASKKSLTDEEQRWVVVGICLTKILTPALRKVLSNEIPKLHQILVNSPVGIDKQTPRKFEKNLPPSTIKLNYDSINNNSVHKSPKLYDYAVKDPLSLGKLFMKPFMASSVTGFDHTMDASAVLSVMCEAQPFHTSGAAILAKKVRTDIRNEWAHCDFSFWTEPNFQTALNDIENLIKKAGLKAAEEKIALDDIDKWRSNGTKLNFGDPADCELLWSEVGNLKESFRLFNEDSKERLQDCLLTVHDFLGKQLCDIRDRQARTEENVGRLNLQQLSLHNQYVSTVQDVEIIKDQVAKIATTSNDTPFVFNAAKKNHLFGGRSSEIRDLASLLRLDGACKSNVKVAAVCGLGGVGKTSLATEYAHQNKEYYTGGVYWFSAEDDTAFENSMFDVATHLGTQSDSFGLTISATLKKISQSKNPWLIILDNMDQLSISANIFKLVSGPWQHDASGQLLIITRRKPTALANDIRDFDERCCLSLECFGIQEGKKFLLRRIGTKEGGDKDVDAVAEKLVQALGGLPLALEEAGAYIKSLSCTLSQYLELYDRQRLRLLSRQKATKISVYDSDERLAVRTTWHLNFEHIKKNVDDGKAASKFLYASAFLNPDEIQKDLINVGEPPVEDEDFNECIKTTLGRQQVVKLLTEFSLFKETLSSSISVHRLVQEVIQNNFENSEEEVSSLIDAVRMLHFAFQSCSSPDELISIVTDDRQKRPSIVSSGNLSRFYNWHKLCLHSYEVVKNLKRLVTQPDCNSVKIFQPETARVVYECAVHLSANSKHDAAKEVANFANQIFNLSNQQVSASSFFPHILPLTELVRRHIQYSCNMPATNEPGECRGNTKMPIDSITSMDLEEMRLKGNELYKRGLYNDALIVYGDAIDMSRNTTLFDVRFLNNRALVYIKLELFKEALQDAEEYILQRSKCWKGYARKAVALVELNDMQGARVAASLAYFYERNVFRNFEPLAKRFDSLLLKRLFVCRDNSDLSAALRCITLPSMFSLIFRRTFSTQFSSKLHDLPVIILEPGDYLVSLNTIDSDLFQESKPDGMHELVIGSCILVGSAINCTITFDDNLSINFIKELLSYNVNFHTRSAEFLFHRNSIVKLIHCSFTSSNPTITSFCCCGKLNVEYCKFHSSSQGGLLVLGDAEIENSEFYGNGVCLQVREGGGLIVRKSKMYANKQGLLIGPRVKECVVEECELYDNQSGVIVVDSSQSCVTIRRNRMYDNDEPGITVMTSSNVSVLDNEILKNSHWGIYIVEYSHAVVKRNKIQHNQCGGICVDSTSSPRRSVLEHNDISFNDGPGIHDEGSLTICRENKLQDNKEKRGQSTTESEAKVCYYCKKPEKNLKKCTKCYTAQYCGKICQKSHWKSHKESCDRLLSDGSVMLEYVHEPVMTSHFFPNRHIRSNRGAGLLPVGPKYCPPPNTSTRFIVKMMAGVAVEQGKKYDPSVIRLYDRSLKIDGILNGADQIYHLVQKHGALGQLFNYWRKLFMWVKGPEHGKLRVFTEEFPPYQHW